jgi:hypothetical protein
VLTPADIYVHGKMQACAIAAKEKLAVLAQDAPLPSRGDRAPALAAT